jgi:hypothetical protein
MNLLKQPSAIGSLQTNARLRRLAVLIVAIALVVGLVNFGLFHSQTSEPTYQARTLASWMDDFGKGTGKTYPAETIEAIRTMGTNALPYLVRMLGASPSPASKELCRIASRVSALRRLWMPPSRWRQPGLRQIQAFEVLQALGRDAAPAAPLLVPLLERTNTSFFASIVLGRMGESASPFLQTVCTNRARWDSRTRMMYLTALRGIRSDDAGVIRAMSVFFDDPDAQVRAYAAQQSAGFPSQSETLVPLLKQRLLDRDTNVQLCADNAIRSIERDALDNLFPRSIPLPLLWNK